MYKNLLIELLIIFFALLIIHAFYNEKFIEGQLDECPLTLKDLEMIVESFVRTLTGVYHTRVQYPEKDEKHKRPKLFSN